MPRCSDFTRVVRRVGLWTLVKRVWREVGEDNLFAWASALSYSWLFALFPFLIFFLSLMPYLPEDAKKTAMTEIHASLDQVLPKDAAEFAKKNVNEIMEKKRKGLMSIGILLMIWGASGGMNMTITALERCYEIDRGRPFYKKRPIAIGLTVVVATLIISLFVLLPVGTYTFRWIKEHGHPYISTPVLMIGNVLRYPMALLLMFTILHVLYQYGPSIRQRFTFITPGAVFAIGVWWLLAVSFRFYVDRWGNYNETYGAVGGVVILLLFFYIDAAVLLIGAEINSEIDFEVLGVERGSRDFTMSRGREAAEFRTEGAATSATASPTGATGATGVATTPVALPSPEDVA